jgi:hypothetical protein
LRWLNRSSRTQTLHRFLIGRWYWYRERLQRGAKGSLLEGLDVYSQLTPGTQHELRVLGCQVAGSLGRVEDFTSCV